MANLQSFGIGVWLSASVANPVNTTYYQVVTPWGQSSRRSSLREALQDIIDRGGSEQTGVMGQYINSQTLNGAATTTGNYYTTATELGQK